MNSLRIFNTRPQNWKDLQNFVGQLFIEVGYHVEISKKVQLVRGKKEIDVYVQDSLNEYKPIFLIECKFWNKPVNQETVHSFHTVINDYGANFGLIVSKKDFQSGCYEAVKNTNIRLVSLEELEQEYYLKWQTGMIKKYLPIADQLFPYWDPTGGKMPKNGKPINWETHQLLNAAYSPFIQLGAWDLTCEMKRNYPLTLPFLNDKLKVINGIVLENDRDYFDFLESNKVKALDQYKSLYGY